MMQIILNSNDNYSMAEMAQIAIEAGCGWLILPDMAIEKLREEIGDIVEMCRENGTILTIRNNVAAAREFGIHGLMLDLGQNPVAVREELGAEAIIGAVIADASSATALAAADIDYFILKPEQAAIAAAAKEAGVENHFVALCKGDEIDNSTLKTLRSEGFSGICADSSLFNCDDPAERIAELTKSI